jgi:hypothetical protein
LTPWNRRIDVNHVPDKCSRRNAYGIHWKSVEKEQRTRGEDKNKDIENEDKEKGKEM